MRRCPSCGAFFKGDACPNDAHHEPDDVLLGPLPDVVSASLGGMVVRFPWPSNGEPTLGVIVNDPNGDGTVGIALLTEDVRIPVDDVEEI